jgi:hypothetical protein
MVKMNKAGAAAGFLEFPTVGESGVEFNLHVSIMDLLWRNSAASLNPQSRVLRILCGPMGKRGPSPAS